MGVYYFFYNKTKFYKQNEKVLNGLFCDFVTRFDSYTKKVQKEIFEKCIKLNDWELTDTILAVPDYNDHNVVEYSNKKVKEIVNHPDKYMFFEKNEKFGYNSILISNKNNELLYNKIDAFNNNVLINKNFKFEVNNKQELYKILLNKDNKMETFNFPCIFIDVLDKIEKLKNTEFPWYLECKFKI